MAYIKKKDGFVLNTGTNVILPNGDIKTYHEIRQIYKKSLYLPYKNDIDISENEVTTNQISRFFNLLDKWPFSSKFDIIKFVGVLICGLVPGGLKQRPCVWITAETGSGKSEFLI